MTEREALKLALEVLRRIDEVAPTAMAKLVMPEIEQALKQPEQEPAACKECHLKDTVYDLLGDLKVANLKLSVRAKRTWVGLTDEEIINVMPDDDTPMSLGEAFSKFAELIEAKLKEKNT
jgi:hypothetical protein